MTSTATTRAIRLQASFLASSRKTRPTARSSSSATPMATSGIWSRNRPPGTVDRHHLLAALEAHCEHEGEAASEHAQERVRDHRARVRGAHRRQYAATPALDRCCLGRGAGLFSRRQFSPLLGHPQRPDHALHPRPLGSRRHDERLPPAGAQHQRPHPRPRGPADLLQPRRPLRLPDRARRHGHHAGRQLRRQAAQLAQRRGGQVRRHGLVHRSVLRHPHRPRGAQGRAGISAAATSSASIPSAAASPPSPPTSSSPTASPSRPDEKLLYIADTGASHPDPQDLAIRSVDVVDDGDVPGQRGGRSRGLRCLRPCRPSTASAATPKAGRRLVRRRRRRRPLLATRRHPDRQDPRCPRWWRTSASAGPQRNRLYICGTTSLYAIYVNVNWNCAKAWSSGLGTAQ